MPIALSSTTAPFPLQVTRYFVIPVGTSNFCGREIYCVQFGYHSTCIDPEHSQFSQILITSAVGDVLFRHSCFIAICSESKDICRREANAWNSTILTIADHFCGRSRAICASLLRFFLRVWEKHTPTLTMVSAHCSGEQFSRLPCFSPSDERAWGMERRRSSLSLFLSKRGNGHSGQSRRRLVSYSCCLCIPFLSLPFI